MITNLFSRRKIIIAASFLGVILVLVFVLPRLFSRRIDISNVEEETSLAKVTKGKKQKSQLTGVECERHNARPFAVMVSSDREARPLAGIGEADMVFEMPVVENGFTRMMAVYQCGWPKEIGSIRSSRLDFVPLALGLNAIYAHFGGEREALEKLNDGIIDNIDGLKYDGTLYYRKKSIPRPHNAFTSIDLLVKGSKDRSYNLNDGKISYPHEEKSKSRGMAEPNPLFNENFRVIWKYDKKTNSYSRWRSGDPEIDGNSGKQVTTKNVIIMKTNWSPINKDYIRVQTLGSGGLLVYKNGAVMSGTWEKKDEQSKLYFYDSNHKEIPLTAGNVWIEIVTSE